MLWKHRSQRCDFISCETVLLNVNPLLLDKAYANERGAWFKAESLQKSSKRLLSRHPNGK